MKTVSFKLFYVFLIAMFTLLLPATAFADVSPMVQSVWGTGTEWNNNCPSDNIGSGGHADAGTMAVSTAMIMKYWNHPANGVGSNTYNHPVYGTLFADFENTSYNWESMSNTLVLSGSRVLISQAGIALNMDYGTNASYAPIDNAFTALTNNFRYDGTAQLVNRDDYSNAAWEQLLKYELNQGRPILYKADTQDGEIGFVIDGWRNGNEFHVNWGKDGNLNGYFTIDSFNYEGIDLTNGHRAVIGIYPSLGPQTVDENFEGDFSGFNWQFGGNSDWTITTNEHYYGVQSAKSGQINHNQTSSLYVQINVEADDVISFNRKVSCENSMGWEPTFDYLSFWIDDNEMDRWDGQTTWSYEEYPVTAGVHTFKWEYRKDGATIEGQDCAWIDAIDFPNGETPLNPVQNFTAEVVNNNDVEMNWDMPLGATRDIVGYRVYRNGQELITVSNPEVLSYTDTNLANGEYTYYVRAFYQEGLSNPSNPITLEVEVPYTPTNLIAEVVSDDDVALTWSQPPTFRNGRSLNGYKIYRNNSLIATVSDESILNYNDNDLPQAVYRYYVTATYTTGESAASNIAIASVGVPTPPTGLTAQLVNRNDVLLNWVAPPTTRELLGYNVYRDDVSIAQVNDATTVSYTDLNVPNGTYTYNVTAIYSNGESEAGTSATISIEVMYPPVNLTYTIENQINIRLAWERDVNTRNLQSYSIFRDGQQIAIIFNPDRLYYLDEDIVNGEYEYYVTATYTSGTSEASNSVNVLMEVLYPCTILNASVDGDVATLSWDRPVNSGGLRSFNGYNIYRGGNLISFVDNPSTLTYQDTGLANGYYNYEVTAVYTTGESIPVSINNVFIEVAYPPRNLSASQEDDDFILTWNAPATSASQLSRNDRVTRSMNGYKVYRDDTEIAHITDTAVLTYRDVALVNGNYSYYVTALYTAEESIPSNVVDIEMDIAYPPTALEGTVNDDDISLSWTAPVNSGGLVRSFINYRIYRDDLLIDTTTELTYTDTDLANGSYRYYVTAVHDAGESTASNTVNMIVEVLYPASNLNTEVFDKNNVRISWIAPVTSGGLRSFNGYKVYRNDEEIAELSSLQYEDLILDNGTYSYYVKAVYDSGLSEASNSDSKVIEYPYPVTNLTAVVDQAEVTLNWDLPQGTSRSITHYQLFRNGNELEMITNSLQTEYVDSNLSNGTYTYYLVTHNDSDSGPSEASEDITATVEVLYPPRNLVATVIEDNVSLSWTAPQTGVFARLGARTRDLLTYKVYRDDVEIAETTDLSYDDNSLSNGTYNYNIKAVYTSGTSEASNTEEVLVEILYPATNFSVNVVEDDVSLSWDSPATSGGLTRAFLGYKIYRDDVEIADITETTYFDSDLTNGTYSYYVVAEYTTGSANPTETLQAIVEVLYPPTALTGEIEDYNNIRLSWTAPVNSGGLRDFVEYELLRNDTVIITQTELTYFDQLIPDGDYTYQVRAVYSSGTSSLSNSVSFNVEYPYPPSNLQANVVDDDVNLSWNAPTNGRVFVQYHIYRNDELLVSVDTNSYSDTNLQNGHYEYYVQAAYSNSVSEASNTVSIDMEVLYPATNLSYSTDQDEVTLTWDSAVTSGGLTRNFLGYKIYRNDAEIAEVSELTYTDVDLANGVYNYYIKANYTSGLSESSNTITATVEVLYPASDLAYSVDQDEVTLTWNAVATSGGLTRDFLGYKVYRDDVEIAEVTELTYTDVDLTNGVYDYYIKANYTSGLSESSNIVTATVEVLYPATNLAYSVDQDEVTLTWDNAVTSGGLTRDFLGYKIYRDETEIAEVTELTYTDTDLANSVYDYYVKANYTSGLSEASNTVTATIEVLYPATNLAYSVDQDEVTLTWDAALTSGGLTRSFLGYKVYRDEEEIAEVTELTYTDVDLANGVYDYYVKANYTSGLSESSNTVTATVEVLYPATNLAYSVDQDEVTLTWNAAATFGGLTRDFLGYKVYRDDVEIAEVTELTYLDADLTNGVYDYYVKANYTSGLSEASNTITATVEVLYPATNLSYSVDQDEVTLIWDSAVTSGGLDRSFLGYMIYRDEVEIAEVPETTYTDIDLANGVYDYYVIANYASGLSETSNTVTATVEVLYPATNLAYSVDQDEVTLTWDAAVTSGGLLRDFLGYKIYRDEVEIAEVTELTYTDTDLTNGVYSYYVKANYTSGLSEASNTITATVEVLYPATNLNYSVDQDEVTLTWDAAVVTGGLDRSFLGYKIYRNNLEIAEVTELTYTDVDLANGIYNYYVRADYTSGLAEASNTVSATVEVLYPATNLSYSVNQDEVTLSWTAVVTEGGLDRSFLGYKIYRDDVEIAETVMTTYVDVDLANGTYDYYIEANYTSGLSEASNTVTATVEVLYPATNLAYSVDQDEVSLTWDAPITVGGLTRSFVGYKVYRDLMEIAEVAELGYTDTGLANGTYSYSVKAVYDSGLSAYSNSVEVLIEVLYPAQNLSGAVTNDDVALTWNAPSVSGSRSLTGYKVYRDNVEIGDVTELSYNDEDLANGTYTYHVVAYYTTGDSEPSNSFVAEVDVPYAPSNLTGSVNEDTVTLNWDLPAVSGGLRSFNGYFIYRNGGLITVLNNSSAQTYFDENLANGDYEYYIVAYYDSGLSAASNTVTVNVNVLPDLFPPTNLQAVVNNLRDVTLSWVAPENNPVSYKVYRNSVEIAEVSMTVFNETLIENGTYTYWVKAVYNEGISSNSNSVIVNVEVAYAPSDLVTSVDDNDVSLTWTNPEAGEIGIIVYRDDVEIALINNSTTNTYTDMNLMNGTYSYHLKAIYTSTVSQASASASATVEIIYPVSALQYEVNTDSVTLNWSEPLDPTGLVNYKVYRNAEMIATETTLSYTDNGLVNGDYDYYIVAQYSTGDSNPSNTVTALVQVAYPVQNVQTAVNGDEVTVSWDEPSDVVGLQSYSIEREGEFVGSTQQLNFTDTDVVNGIYTYTVKASYEVGFSEPVNAIPETIVLVAYAPTALTQQINENIVTLNWNEPSDMNAFQVYNVYRDGSLVGSSDTNEYTDENLANGTYEYYVVAVHSIGELSVTSNQSNTIQVVVSEAYPPTGLNYVIDNGNDLTLTWDAPVDTNDISHYNVYKNGSLETGVTELTYTENDLVNGTYEYYVEAYYNSGATAASNHVTLNVEVAYVPTGLAVVVTSNNVNLTWTAPTDNVGLLSYNVYRDEALIGNSTTATYDDLSLANGTYDYTVSAVYGVGESTQTAPVVANIEIAYVPSNLTTSVTDDDVILSWDAPADVTGLVSYNVYRDGSSIGNTTTASFTDSDLANGDYSYTVSAVYGTEESAQSTASSAHVEVVYVAQNLTSSAVNDDVILTWEAPVDTFGIQHYNIYRDTESIGTSTELTYTDSDLMNSHYIYTVSAVYGAGESGQITTEIDVVVAYEPQIAEADVQTGTHYALLNWTAPTDNGFLTGYRIYRLIPGQLESPELWIEVENLVNAVTYTDEDFATLTDGLYLYAVASVYMETMVSDVTFTNVIDPTGGNEVVTTPAVTSLSSVYPNPFNPSTSVSFSLSEKQRAVVKVYNSRGQYVKTIIDDTLEKGEHCISWNGRDKNNRGLASGVYFIRMQTADYSKSIKAVLMK